jgi:ubiquinone/menaquinone biosynthesis C-methylase UbiE
MGNLFGPSTTERTKEFYEALSSGSETRGIWGKENRFDPALIATKPSVLRHFVEPIRPFLSTDHACLDLGCGPGGFLTLAAPMCGRIVGVDVVPSFAQQCEQQIERAGLTNASVILNTNPRLPFDDAEFDRVLMVDTIHHLEDVEATLAEVHRVLKPDGTFLIFEPNKLNPLLALMCALDRNEHGLLRMGTFGAYRRILKGKFEPYVEKYNGVLIGPTGSLSNAIADFVSDPKVAPFLGWLSPKIFLAARRVS